MNADKAVGMIMEKNDLERIEAMMRHVVGIFAEDVQHKMDILAEGQQMLAEKLDSTRTELKTGVEKLDYRLTVVEARLDHRFGELEKKVDGFSENLAAHRRDTEAHRKGWRVGEE
jgi:hypothetical protein